MDVKPRKNTGVLMSVHGKHDFMMLQMKDGSIELSIDNGKGIITVRYKPATPWSLCDGRWHSVKVIKNKYVAVLLVDGDFTKPILGQIGAIYTHTKDPLFLGTQTHISKHRGDPTYQKFVGCIRNVQIDREYVDLDKAKFIGNVNVSSC
ncbi:unnamed protein product, partial [Meganyctiphanes norvegica]